MSDRCPQTPHTAALIHVQAPCVTLMWTPTHKRRKGQGRERGSISRSQRAHTHTRAGTYTHRHIGIHRMIQRHAQQRLGSAAGRESGRGRKKREEEPRVPVRVQGPHNSPPTSFPPPIGGPQNVCMPVSAPVFAYGHISFGVSHARRCPQ